MKLAQLPQSLKLKIVVLEAPYDSLEQPTSHEMFGKLMALRLRGYEGKYRYGIMPLDTSDFIATHLAVCLEKNGELMPIMGYKSVKEPKCRLHGIPFSGLQLPISAGATKPIQAVQEIVKRSQNDGSLAAYDGGWTIDPAYRKDRALVEELKNLFTCMQVNYYGPYQKFDLLCGGLIRFKTDRFFREWGYKPLNLNGEELGPFPNPSLGNEPILMLHVQSFSQHALDIAKSYQHYWDNRLVIGQSLNSLEEIQRKVAA